MTNSGKFAGALALAAMLPASALAQADFTRYVAFGDSLTAGFDSGSLVSSAQATSYPALLARQFGTADFQQPLVTEPGLPAQLQLVSLSPLVIAPKGGRGNPANLNLPRPYNNIAVPGADVADLVGTLSDIPDVTNIAFVTAISRFIINPATGQPVAGPSGPLTLIGPNGTLGAGDFVLLTASTELAQGRGIPVALGGGGQPLSDAATLLAPEVAAIRARTTAFNAVIRSAADQAGAAFVDANAIFADIGAHGVNIGGVTYTAAFLTGGLFSYDGVHPTPFGYAYVANRFIDSINVKFNEDVEPVDLFPFVFGASSVSGAAISRAVASRVAYRPPFIFTAEAAASLRQGLGVPSEDELQRIVRRRRR